MLSKYVPQLQSCDNMGGKVADQDGERNHSDKEMQLKREIKLTERRLFSILVITLI